MFPDVPRRSLFAAGMGLTLAGLGLAACTDATTAGDGSMGNGGSTQRRGRSDNGHRGFGWRRRSRKLREEGGRPRRRWGHHAERELRGDAARCGHLQGVQQRLYAPGLPGVGDHERRDRLHLPRLAVLGERWLGHLRACQKVARRGHLHAIRRLTRDFLTGAGAGAATSSSATPILVPLSAFARN